MSSPIASAVRSTALVIEGGILSNDRLHAPHSWRELRVLDVQFDIRGELPGVTMWAQVVRPRDFHFTDYRQHGLSAEFPVSGPLAAITRDGALIGVLVQRENEGDV